MVTTPTHGSVNEGTQSVMYSILSANTGVTAITKNIYDGDPWKIGEKYGLPYIIINSSRYSKARITEVKWGCQMIIPITYRVLQESVLRELHDAIEKAIIDAEMTLLGYGMADPSFSEPVPDNDVINDSKTVYGFSRDVFFNVVVSNYP